MPPPCRTCLATVPFAVPRQTNPSVAGESRNSVWALLPRAESGSLTGGPLHYLITNNTEEVTDDWYRYIGQGRYYIFEVEVTDIGPGFLPKGENTIIVPEGVFYSTKFYTLLNSTDQANVTTNFSYLPTDTAWQAPDPNSSSAAYVINFVVLELNASQANDLAQSLINNASGNLTYLLADSFKDNVAGRTPLALSGLPLVVTDLVPRKVVMYPQQMNQEIYTFWNAVWSTLGNWAKSLKDFVMDGLKWVAYQIGLGWLWEDIVENWDDIVGAVAGFFSFLIEIVNSMIIEILNPVITPIISSIESFVFAIGSILESALDDNGDINPTSLTAAVPSLLNLLFMGILFLSINYLFTALKIVEAITKPFIMGASTLLSKISDLIIPMVLSAIAGAALGISIAGLETAIESEDALATIFGVVGIAASMASILVLLYKTYQRYPMKDIGVPGLSSVDIAIALVGLAIVTFSTTYTDKIEDENKKKKMTHLIDIFGVGLDLYGLYSYKKDSKQEWHFTYRLMLPLTSKVEKWVIYGSSFASLFQAGVHYVD